MGLQQQLAQGLFPVGSTRRRKVVDAARSLGLAPKPIQTDYERWVERVEPHLWSAQFDPHTSGRAMELRPDPHTATAPSLGEFPNFLIQVKCDAETSPADITATAISLSDQSYPRWSAVMNCERCTPETLRSAQRAIDGDKRLALTSPAVTDEATYVLSIDAGSTLALRGLNELATVLGRHDPADTGDGFVAVVADADSLVPVTRRREFPMLMPEPHADLVEQYDITSACIARSAVSEGSVEALVQDGKVAYTPRVVLHRKRTQPPRVALLAATTRNGTHGAVAADEAGRGSGTRIRHLAPKGTTVDLVIRDAFDGMRGAQHLAKVQADTGERTTIVGTSVWMNTEPFRLGTGEVTVIIDGSVTPPESNWLDDLVGALMRPHVLAVAPVILAPSGVAFDAGIELTNIGMVITEDDSKTVSLKARSGRLDFPPYDMARVTPVASLSTRVVVIRSYDAALLAQFTTRDLYSLARTTKRTCLIWAHQRWRMDASFDGVSPLTPALAAWKQGRLGQWVDPTIEPHHPAPARIGEGVW